MKFTRRQTAGRGRLSLRSRLLAGLIAITFIPWISTVFL